METLRQSTITQTDCTLLVLHYILYPESKILTIIANVYQLLVMITNNQYQYWFRYKPYQSMPLPLTLTP